MGIYNNLMDQLTDAGALFNVSTDTLLTGNGTVVANKKAIINNNNGKVIGLVGQNYRVVPNEEIFDSFCRSVEASDIDSTDATVNVSFAKDGARTLVDFVFPNEHFKVNGDSSTTALSITALNSFDGSTRYLTKAGGLRMKCLNGQLLGTVAGSYSSTHSPNLSVEEGAKQVVRMLQDFRKAQDYFGDMMSKRVGDEIAAGVILKYFDKEDIEQLDKNKNARQVFQNWKIYKMEMGDNLYALYNALTDYVTHKQSKTGAAGRLIRERKMLKLLRNFDQPEQVALAA